MHAPALLLSAALLAPPAALPEGALRAAANPLAGPARCVLRYLDAVRLAGPRTPLRTPPPDARAGSARETVRRLLAPRTLADIERRAAEGAGHPLALPRDPATQPVLESFRLVRARHAALGAAVVTVSERFWRAPRQASLEVIVSEYLVGRVGGEWRVVDRRPRGTFADGEIATAYAGFFDAPEER